MYMAVRRISPITKQEDHRICRAENCQALSDFRFTVGEMMWHFCEQHSLDALLDAMNFAVGDQQDLATLAS